MYARPLFTECFVGRYQKFLPARIRFAPAPEQQQLLGLGKSCLGYSTRRAMPLDPLKTWGRVGPVLIHLCVVISKKVLAYLDFSGLFALKSLD